MGMATATPRVVLDRPALLGGATLDSALSLVALVAVELVVVLAVLLEVVGAEVETVSEIS